MTTQQPHDGSSRLQRAAAKTLGRLESVPLRDFWVHEHTEFTPWLAAPDNLRLLGDAIGRELEPQGQEVGVGQFRADILCRDVETEELVVVENQVEQTDHLHLGQILTYVAGLRAKTVVWIARQFREEHRAALDWLNENTNEGIEFYGVQIELWRIGDSAPAPRFSVVAHPNEWSRVVRERSRSSSDLTPAEEDRVAFWDALATHLRASGSRRRPPHGGRRGFRAWPLGTPDFRLVVAARPSRELVFVMLVIHGVHAKERFRRLLAQRVDIEADLRGIGLEWRELPDRKESQIRAQHACDFDQPDVWPPVLAWVASTLDALERAFGSRVQALARSDASED